MTIPRSSKKRLVFLVLGLFGLLSLLIIQFYKIQILEGEKWNERARRQHFFVITEPFQRGTFYSNTSIKRAHPEIPQKLVFDVEKYHLYIDPLSIPEKYRDGISEFLMNTLTLTVPEQLVFRKQFDRKSRSRRMAKWLDRNTRDEIMNWWTPFARKNKIARNALYFVIDYQRSYPFDKLLGQVLHTIQDQKDEKTKQAFPTGGLELSMNPYLQGKEGKRLMMRTPRNAFDTGQMIETPENGADIYLTINHCLQEIAEEEIEKGVKKCKAKSGWAVMMDPRNGDILALAQYPFFTPAEYRHYFNDPNLIQETRVKALTDAHEPGSVMKPITVAVALKANEEESIFDPDEMIATTDTHFPGRSKPLRDLRTHQFMNLDIAMQKSANVYMARLVERVIHKLGNDWYRHVLHETFGFGKKVGLELPSESSGILPTPGKKHPNGKLEWSKPTPYSLAIGHNLQVNSVQLLRAYSILANGGYLVQPKLVRKVVKKDKILLDKTQIKLNDFPKVLTKKSIDRIIQALKYVTKPGGSARRGDVYGYTEVGKSGTSEKIVNGRYSKQKHVAHFIGFTPIDEPAFVLIVVMDEPECIYLPGIGKNHHGGIASAPVFRDIARRSLEYLGIAPDDPFGYPNNDPRYDEAKAHWVKEAKELKILYDKWNS